MKAISGIALGIACSTFSVAASSATEAHTRACVDEFIAEELNNRPAEVRIDRAPDFPMPLVLLSEVPMQLKAVERASGRTIATATCDPQRGLVEVRNVGETRNVDETR